VAKHVMITATIGIGLLLAFASVASADPTAHFSTFTIHCGGNVYEIVSKPGSSNVVTVNGLPSTSVSVLMGLTITVSGETVFEFHKPFTEHQSFTVCRDEEPGGVVVVAEVLFTPRN